MNVKRQQVSANRVTSWNYFSFKFKTCFNQDKFKSFHAKTRDLIRIKRIKANELTLRIQNPNIKAKYNTQKKILEVQNDQEYQSFTSSWTWKKNKAGCPDLTIGIWVCVCPVQVSRVNQAVALVTFKFRTSSSIQNCHRNQTSGQ